MRLSVTRKSKLRMHFRAHGGTARQRKLDRAEQFHYQLLVVLIFTSRHLVRKLYLTMTLWSRDFDRAPIVDRGTARVNNQAIKIETLSRANNLV